MTVTATLCGRSSGEQVPECHWLPAQQRQAFLRGTAKGLCCVPAEGKWDTGRITHVLAHTCTHMCTHKQGPCPTASVPGLSPHLHCRHANPLSCRHQERASALGSAEWRHQISEVDTAVLEQLRRGIKGGFDEERHGPHIGFGNLKR